MWPLAIAAGGSHLASPLSAKTGAIRRTIALGWLILALWTLAAVSQTLPYVPTTLLMPGTPGLPPQNGTAVVYIISPSESSVDLLLLNISSTLQAPLTSLETLSTALPFLDPSDSTNTFTASIQENGTIAVYAGDCAFNGNQSLWAYNPTSHTDGAKGSWTTLDTTTDASLGQGARGPSFLGSSLSFSSTLAPNASEAVVYIYGGMCPYNSTANASDWQLDATYSNRMLRLSPTDQSDAYSISAVSAKGPPVADAGFTLSPLLPSISNRSGIVNQQVNYVLLGGHTQDAFVNMSAAAIWSLPEETWSFVSIDAPATNGNTELAVKNLPTSVDSRSGHTAVLTEDGSALVILGGWVGDLSQAADPQLAVLEMGASYGDWQWSIPNAQPPGPGIYGHGAVLLPGNVMMVFGGYTISTAASKPRKRQAGATGSTPMFLDLTSMTWSNQYTNPTYQAPQPGSGTQSADGETGASSGKSKQIGLGVGLGLGIPLLIAIVTFCICYQRKVRRERAERDDAVRGLAQDHTQFLSHPEDDEMAEHDNGGLFPWNGVSARDWYTGGHDPYMREGRSLGYETLRGGTKSSPLLYPMPPAAMTSEIRRKPVASRNIRGLYQNSASTANYDFSPLVTRGTPGRIHPIYEADEELEEPSDDPLPSPENEPEDTKRYSDPFLTPTKATAAAAAGTSGAAMATTGAGRESTTPSPEGSRSYTGQDPEVQDWVSDIDAADALLTARIQPHSTTTCGAGTAARPMHSGGRLSPSRRASLRSKAGSPVGNGSGDEDARTVSNLSESGRSAFSAAQQAQSTSRSGSVRSHFRAAATDARLGSSGGASSSSGNTWNTAKSSFPTLQAEGPGLLLLGREGGDGFGAAGEGGSGGRARSNTAGTAGGATEDDEPDATPGSPSKRKSRQGWLGSLKRVFSGGASSSTNTSSRGDSPSPMRASFHEGSSDFEPYLGGLGGLAGGRLLLRRKQGREAWLTGEDGEGFGGAGAGGAGGEEDDWDVERAVEQRLVQVMFTVPKERLRVVNADLDLDKEEEAIVVDPEKEDVDDDDDYDDEGMGKGSEIAASPRDALEDKGRETPEAVRRRSSGILTAEAVRLERPRTRVLEMVDSIEGRSRSESPGTPSRGSGVGRS